MRTFIILLAVAIAGGAALAVEPATLPATRPNGVLILPFAPVGDVGQYSWVGQAVQQNLLTTAKASLAAQSGADPVLTTDAARQAGTVASAAKVVMGSYQLVNDELRLTGQILDVATGQVAASLKATGPVRDLFGLEDDLARQFGQAMGMPVAPIVAPAPVAPPVGNVAPAPAAGDIAPVEQSVYPWDRQQPVYPREYNYRYQYPTYYSPWSGYSPYYGGCGYGSGYNTFGSFGGSITFGHNPTVVVRWGNQVVDRPAPPSVPRPNPAPKK